MPHFDWTITLGSLATFVSLLITLGGFLLGMHRQFVHRLDALESCIHRHLGGDEDEPMTTRLTVLESRMADLWSWFTGTLERRDRPR